MSLDVYLFGSFPFRIFEFPYGSCYSDGLCIMEILRSVHSVVHKQGCFAAFRQVRILPGRPGCREEKMAQVLFETETHQTAEWTGCAASSQNPQFLASEDFGYLHEKVRIFHFSAPFCYPSLGQSYNLAPGQAKGAFPDSIVAVTLGAWSMGPAGDFPCGGIRMGIDGFLEILGGNPVFWASVAVATGVLLGGVKIRGVGLGTSGALFTGLALGWLGATVPEEYFIWNLLVFVTAVGLLSSRDIGVVIRRWGFRFMLLAVAVTGAGALATWLMALLFSGAVEPLLVGGTYTGALTSSPGLGAALEATGGNSLVTIGYTIAYPFGVIAVVLAVQMVPAMLKVDIPKEREDLIKIIHEHEPSSAREIDPSAPFTLISFVICIIGGIVLGSLRIPIPWVGEFSLGSTGGALLLALFLGARGRIGPFPMGLDVKVLSALRLVSLAYFLAVMGIMAGPDIPAILARHGVALVGIGIVSAMVSLVTGFVLGRCVFRLNWVLLAGAIPGAMTSTPGLGAAIESTGCDECSAGYGATYPAAIFCMVLFTKMIMLALS